MELHSVHKTFQPSHLGEQKHEMLSLNRRLETYLNRVKLLEEENALLAQEIQAVRHSSHGAVTRRKGLEEELRQTRLEVDAAWRDRVHTELEIGKLTEEFQNLDLQIQREAQAHAKARAMLEQSRKELEEEQRAQIWLREKVNQLENEMKHLIQTHHEEVAHLETAITHPRVTVPPALAHRANHTPNVLQLGQEYTQMASRARQEVSEAYEGQLARLEESLDQTSGCLAKVKQEKSEAQLRIQALQKEIASAQDVRLHLEKTAAQQRDLQSQEIQQLQEHMEGLEVEKEEVGQQIDHLLLENRHLMELKMSLGLEVATYRALLDSEGLRGGSSVLHQPRKVSIKDGVFCSQVVKKSYQTQLSASRNITSLIPVCGTRGTRPVVTTAKPDCTRKLVTSSGTAVATKSTKCEASYPKILQDGAAENFRRQEVHEKVAHAEPLSPPIDDKVLVLATSEGNEFEENSNSVDSETEEIPVVESCVSSQVESGLSSEPPLSDEYCHLLTTSNLTPCLVRMTEMSCGLSDEPDRDVGFEGLAEKEDTQPSHATIDATAMKECTGVEEEQVQEETSDSETEAVLEPTFESRTCSPTSECESVESAFKQFTDFSRGENFPNVDVVEVRQEISSSVVETNQTNVEDKLYPDGEEMDTWDCVIEKKPDLKTDDEKTNEEAKRQHAEPEEDISAREPGREKTEIRQDFATDVQDNIVVSSGMDTHIYDDVQHAALDQEHVLLSDKDDEEEDSQNVSMSWRMEVEGDSYAQDNTLADTRPLIRYKSDETDANTHASHMDESESSEGEQEKKIGEMGTWSEGKSKKFGTMEDLCEEAEGEALDEEYDMGYTHTEDRNVDPPLTTGEYATLMKDTEKAEEAIKNVTEGQSSEDTGEFPKAMVPTNIDYDEQLETDRLVEQELENLCTESYSAHFAQQLDSESQEILSLQGNSVERMTDQEEAGKTEAMCADPAESVTHELTSTVTIVDLSNEDLHLSDSPVVIPQADSLADDETQHVEQEVVDAPRDERNVSMVTHADETEDAIEDFISRPSMEEINNGEDPNSALQENVQDVIELTSSVTTVDERNENLYFSDSSVVIPQADSLADDETQHVEQEVVDAPRDEHNVSMVTHADETEDGINDFISRPSMEEINNAEDPNSALQDVDDPLKVKEVVPLDVSKDSQELAEDVTEPAEWEVLENPSEDSEATDETEKCDNVPESAESHHHDDKGSDEALTAHKDKLLESSPDSVPAENNIFVVKDSTELMNKSGTDNDLQDVFSSGMKNDFWVSSVETSATYQRDEACNDTDEQTNPSPGFGDNLVWGNLENQNVVNGNSRVDTESTKALAAEEEQGQRHSEVKKVLSRNVEGEMVHSEESEIEGESWSSGEEQL